MHWLFQMSRLATKYRIQNFLLQGNVLKSKTYYFILIILPLLFWLFVYSIYPILQHKTHYCKISDTSTYLQLTWAMHPKMIRNKLPSLQLLFDQKQVHKDYSRIVFIPLCPGFWLHFLATIVAIVVVALSAIAMIPTIAISIIVVSITLTKKIPIIFVITITVICLLVVSISAVHYLQTLQYFEDLTTLFDYCFALNCYTLLR